MEKYVEYIFKIAYYFIFSISLFIYLKKREEHSDNKKIGVLAIIIFGIIFGYYGIICGPAPYSHDRLNYAIRFLNDGFLDNIRSNSYGLYIIYKIFHLVSHSPNFLFFGFSFLYFCFTMFVYNKCEDSKPLGILFALLNTYGLYGFYMLKQAPALIAISFAFIFLCNKKYLKTIICIAIGILFHESSLIMIPIFIILLFKPNSRLKNIISFLILIFFTVFFYRISGFIFNLINNIPGLDLQISLYRDSLGSMVVENHYFTALKGLPFYLILFFGIIKSGTLKFKIKNYYNKMFITIFVCTTSILSFYNYWMWRFGAFFYLLTLFFGAEIYYSMDKSKDRKIYLLLLMCSLLGLQIKLLIQYFFKYGGIM